MAGFTYGTLKTAIQDYLDNSETTFTNNLDNFSYNIIIINCNYTIINFN